MQGSENGRVVTIGVNIAKRNITTGIFGLKGNIIIVKTVLAFGVKLVQRYSE